MYLAYYDEAGDDGYPEYSSPLFVLSALYLSNQDWTETFTKIRNFRRGLSTNYGLPVQVEFHMKQFLWNKNPYRELNISNEDRIRIVDGYCDLIGALPMKIINVVIDKEAITSDKYLVLDKALTYSIQRIENDLTAISDDMKFVLITDPGRIGKMRRIAREKRAINYIPSRIEKGTAYRQEIKSLIEDPLSKDSKDSFFIQSADLITYIVYLHKLVELNAGGISPRISKEVTPNKLRSWLEKLKPSLNLKATKSDPFGIVVYPKR